ncbi:radical SAM protein [Streptomyces sp. NPDC006632]|uniref:radical SAM protein n=1 Tax=Streptomyces sp. NPDC006632 TaxID=3157182 RepID=UPI0033B63544
MGRPIVLPGQASSCYFRTTVDDPYRKALIQICEPCNEKCAHCFVSATKRGDYMPLADIENKLLPQLIEARVNRITLTGGEPFMHPALIEIVRLFRAADMKVGICTNATIVTDQHIADLVEIGDVHMNVSLDGFSPDSHGKFRGRPEGFAETVETVQRFGRAGILQGLLCTPNNLAEDAEYRQLCEFARDNGATYVLMNPLGEMGRGENSAKKLRRPDHHMVDIEEMTRPLAESGELEVYNVRFPNEDKPLAGCEAGTIIYVFTKGEVAVCPYLVFAARTKVSQHPDTDFIVGNVWTDTDVAARLDAYKFHERFRVGNNTSCTSCSLESKCGKGCPAAVVAAGRRVGQVDTEQCPVVPDSSRVLTLVEVS